MFFINSGLVLCCGARLRDIFLQNFVFQLVYGAVIDHIIPKISVKLFLVLESLKTSL